MSSTNKTKFYGLSQFEPTDTPSWQGDYNGDMKKIDEAIHEAAENGGSDVTVETEDGKATISVTKDGETKTSEISTITEAQSDKLDGLADIKKVGANLTLEEDGTLNAEKGTVDFNGLDNRPKYNGAAMTGSTDIPDLSGQVSENTSKIATNASEIAAVDTLIKSTQSNLTTEVTNREGADQAIQSQIDALIAKTDVVDIVGDYTQLQDYDTSKLGSRDVVEVLNDVNHDGALSYYRWNDPNVGEWNWIGSISPYYTKSESTSIFVPKTRTINGQSLEQDIIIELPAKLSQLANDSGFITSSALTNLVPNTRTVNGKALSEDVVLKTSDLENDSNYVNQTELANELEGIDELIYAGLGTLLSADESLASATINTKVTCYYSKSKKLVIAPFKSTLFNVPIPSIGYYDFTMTLPLPQNLTASQSTVAGGATIMDRYGSSYPIYGGCAVEARNFNGKTVTLRWYPPLGYNTLIKGTTINSSIFGTFYGTMANLT